MEPTVLADERAGTERRPARGWRWAYAIGGGCLLALALLFALAVPETPGAASWILALMALGAGWLAVRVFYAGRRFLAISGAERLAHDSRAPVLYLRCFSDDSTAGRFGAWYRIQQYTEEEQLAAVLNQIGPFVAVGRPGESKANLGAARLYFSDDEWQEKVTALMARSRLVVMRTGDSDGLWWEIKEVLRVVPPEKLVLLVDDEDEMATFCAQLGKKLSVNVVSPQIKHGRIGSLRGVVVFRADWSPRLLKTERSFLRQSLRRPHEARLRLTMKPLFERAGVAWSKPPLSKSKAGFLSLAALVFFVAADQTDPVVQASDALVAQVSGLPEFASSNPASLSDDERKARVMDLAAQGLKRLPDTVALERATVIERMLNVGDEAECAALRRGGAETATTALYARLSSADLKTFFGSMEVAATSELRQVPVVADSDTAIKRLFPEVLQHVPAHESARFADVMSRLATANDKDFCWAWRLFYRVASLLPPPEQAMGGRF